MAVDNHTILHKIWLEGTNDFQQRIPEPTQTNIQQVIQTLFDPMNRMYYNQFLDALVMRIGDTFVHQQSFKNSLAVFKKSRMMYGNTLQEIIPKWIRAHAYTDDCEDVFKMARPEVATWYHSQNRRDRYDITINDNELRTAFTDSMGLNKLVAAIMNVPMNSDEYDEYRIMVQLIAMYENTWGFYKHSLTAAPTSDSTGKEFLYWLRTYSRKLQFPTTVYNNGSIEDIPVFVKPNELVIIMTPETQAAIDVYTLAGVFNLDKADIEQRIIIIDEFPIATLNSQEAAVNPVALLTTEDFFMCKDTEYRTTSMYNPKTLGTNYFLHHWGVYSVSPFVPAILFVVDAATTSVPVLKQIPSGLTVNTAGNVTTIAAGNTLDLKVALLGTMQDGSGNTLDDYEPFAIAPNAATFDINTTRTVSGTQGVYKITVGGTWAANDTVTVDGITATVASGSTTTTNVATAIKNAMANSTHYTVTSSGAVVTLTEKSGQYGYGAPVSSKVSTSGTLTAATTTQGTTTVVAFESPETRVETYDGNTYRLYAAPDLQTNDQIAITATATYTNPSGTTSTYTATKTITVS